MKYQRRPTTVQTVMIVCMGVAFGALFIWLVPELLGAFSPAAEDTYSEWVWDQPLWQVLTIASLHMVAGIAFIWSAGHFIEGWKRRRDDER